MATLKHNPIEIDKDNPFTNCKLQRQPYAEVLTDIVRNYADGFVLAINNEWGTGKTTFVKMWQQHLINHEFQTLYFNAWENDFEDDVLVALLSELEELKEDETKEVFNEVIKRAAPLAKKLLPSVAKALAKKYIGDEFVRELIEGAADVSSEGLEAELKSYTNRKESIQSFRECLANFVEAADPDKPVVFILDELDRCRPNYAVRVLEQIKHLFSVPGIVFVLSIDKNQLGHAVRGVYGSESLNADEYLRRFIDLEFTLPKPHTEQYCDHLFVHFGLRDFFRQEKRRGIQPFREDEADFIKTANLLFKDKNLNLRQLEKIFALCSVAIKSMRFNEYVISPLFLFLVYLRIHYSNLYFDIRANKFSPQELLHEVEGLFPTDLNEDEKDFFYLIEAFLISLYNNSLTKGKLNLYPNDAGNIPLHSTFDKSANNGNLAEYLRIFRRSADIRTVPLYFFMKRIELVERLKEN